jgi:broad specificity phosphatase PhoE
MVLRILMMRHGEKSDDPMDPDLTPDGQKRADALATYIPDKFGRQDFIFATAISRHSARPYETVKPLATAAGVPIDATYADQDYGALATHLTEKAKFQGKLVVVCWHHGNIPNLMHTLRAPDGTYPDPWRRGVFNLILDTRIADQTVTVEQDKEPF